MKAKDILLILDSNQCLPSLFLSPKDKFLPYLNPQRGGSPLSSIPKGKATNDD